MRDNEFGMRMGGGGPSHGGIPFYSWRKSHFGIV